jgi:ACS family phthalate transporter-like MFS transporter
MTSEALAPAAAYEPSEAETTSRLYRKIALRLVPFLFICYMLNYIDRVNISFAALQFRQDLGISTAAYGFGVGIFFAGYVFFEVPSNLVMQRYGAKRTIMRILILWGLVSISTMFISTANQFYVVRVLLGIAEAGFFPGIIYYFTRWFPSALRARIVSQFVVAIALSGIIGGPISGWIMESMANVGGLRGWQWLFLLEGIPPIIAGVVAYYYLDDGPEDAKWLTPSEKQLILRNLELEGASRASAKHATFATALKDPRLFVAAMTYFTIPWAGSIINYWGPTIIRNSGVAETWKVGVLSAIPYIIGGLGMLAINRHSDLKLERRWHYAGSILLAAVAIALLPSVSTDWALSIAVLSVLSIGYLAATAVFWSIPTAYLSNAAAAGSIALISSIGQCGGFVAPNVIGWVQLETGSMANGLYIVAAVLCVGTVLLLVGMPSRLLKERHL